MDRKGTDSCWFYIEEGLNIAKWIKKVSCTQTKRLRIIPFDADLLVGNTQSIKYKLIANHSIMKKNIRENK